MTSPLTAQTIQNPTLRRQALKILSTIHFYCDGHTPIRAQEVDPLTDSEKEVFLIALHLAGFDYVADAIRSGHPYPCRHFW